MSLFDFTVFLAHAMWDAGYYSTFNVDTAVDYLEARLEAFAGRHG